MEKKSGRVQKSQKKFLRAVIPCGFPIYGDKKGGKSKLFCFLRSGERENDKNIKKKIYFFPSGSVFTFVGLKLAGKDDWEVFRG